MEPAQVILLSACDALQTIFLLSPLSFLSGSRHHRRCARIMSHSRCTQGLHRDGGKDAQQRVFVKSTYRRQHFTNRLPRYPRSLRMSNIRYTTPTTNSTLTFCAPMRTHGAPLLHMGLLQFEFEFNGSAKVAAPRHGPTLCSKELSQCVSISQGLQVV